MLCACNTAFHARVTIEIMGLIGLAVILLKGEENEELVLQEQPREPNNHVCCFCCCFSSSSIANPTGTSNGRAIDH